MRKCFREIYSLHAGQFSEITSPHFLFAGANDVIEKFKLFVAVHESESGRYCCKSRKSSDPENLAKVDLWNSPQLRRFSTPLRRFVIDFG